MTNDSTGALQRLRRALSLLALCALVATGTATWLTGGSAEAAPAAARPAAGHAKAAPAAAEGDDDDAEAPRSRGGKKDLTGRLNLNTASEEQLQLLPGVGPAKAERIVQFRSKHGQFKRVADLRKVKGFGYKSLKKLEPFLDIKGDNSLTEK
jgi:competence ComEA-like helix-hairpin-helix protein